MPSLKLKKHPRLFGHINLTEHLKEKIKNPFLKHEAEGVLSDANRLVKQKPVQWEDVPSRLYPTSHQIASQVENLSGAYALTGDHRYRKAAIQRVESLIEFPVISCEAGKGAPDKPDFFCLTYGWHSVAVGYLYDLIRSDISEEEDSILIAFLDKHLMKRAIQCLERPPWWANAGWSNWNGVCAGGMGILALSFYDRYPEAKKILSFVDQSLNEYLRSYITNGGGCPEGTGYYNYGMQFSIPYLKCWESATGKKHPALKIKELGKSLYFPIDFHHLTFGDNDGWGPTGYQFWLAARMGEKVAGMKAACYLKTGPVKTTGRKGRLEGAHRGTLLYVADHLPSPEDVEKFKKSQMKKSSSVARVYKGMAWAAMAEREVSPSLRMTVRGGTTAPAGHASQDQFSFKCMVNGERMISDQHDRPGVSFTKRGNDVYGRSAASKSGLFIEGLGCDLHMKTDTTEVVKGKGITGIRVHGGESYLTRWKNAFIGRLFLLVDNQYWVIIDRQNAGNNCMEARFHTFADSKSGKDWVKLKSGKESMTMSFQSFDKAVLQTSSGMPTYPDEMSTIYRWITSEPRNDNVLVTAMNPGKTKLGISLERGPRGTVSVRITIPGKKARIIRVNKELKLL